MVNQQKGVQQEIAYCAVVVNDQYIPVPAYNVSMTPFGSKTILGMGIPFTTTALYIGSFLLHSPLIKCYTNISWLRRT